MCLELLQELERVSGRNIRDLFDLIIGVSTGSIIGTLLATNRHSVEGIMDLYVNSSKQLFEQSKLQGTVGLVSTNSYYDSKIFEDWLKELMGTTKMYETSFDEKCPALAFLSTVVSDVTTRPFVFRNYFLPPSTETPYPASSTNALWEGIRASSAAPTYFKELVLDQVTHLDGAMTANNPSQFAIQEALLLWPQEKIHCLG